MRSGPAKHLLDLLTFVEARVDDSSELFASSTKISAIDEIDPSSDDFPNNQVRLHASEIECSKMSEPRFDLYFSSMDPMDPLSSSTVLLGL